MTDKIEQAFDAIEWHDAVLLNVIIDRKSPGERDDVLISIQWQDGERRDIRFSDCYAFDAQMNFGVTAPESIRAARCTADSPELAEIRQRWIALGVALEDLLCFEITTNSTASMIRVFSRRFEVITAPIAGW